MPVTKYIWDIESDNLLMETDEVGSTTAVYTNEPGLHGALVSQRRGTTDSYYHFDESGSTRELTDSSETVTDTNLDDAWGVEVDSSGTTENPFRFSGEYGVYWGEETTSYYVGERTYEPQLARFTAKDYNGALVSVLATYVYASNNPLDQFAYAEVNGVELQSNYESMVRQYIASERADYIGPELLGVSFSTFAPSPGQTTNGDTPKLPIKTQNTCNKNAIGKKIDHFEFKETIFDLWTIEYEKCLVTDPVELADCPKGIAIYGRRRCKITKFYKLPRATRITTECMPGPDGKHYWYITKFTTLPGRKITLEKVTKKCGSCKKVGPTLPA